jgi:hypothetical protein
MTLDRSNSSKKKSLFPESSARFIDKVTVASISSNWFRKGLTKRNMKAFTF